MERNNSQARPFLKWAGGKSQLLSQFEAYYPKELATGEISAYVEPFVGGGAVFLHIVQKYDSLKSFYLFDSNPELVLVYIVVKKKHKALIERLEELSRDFFRKSGKGRRSFYNQVRAEYNSYRPRVSFKRLTAKHVERAAQMIFLNKTCYNGLFRLNRNGEFNVPFGSYKHPRILDSRNIERVSTLLQRAEIAVGDFTTCEPYVDRNTFVYFDPPYRPITQTSNFTSYSQNGFDETQQIRLARFFSHLDKKYRAKLMLSNSDPANENPEDRFFQEHYNGFNLYKVTASRMINSIGNKRGQITELLITNYKNKE